MWCCGRVQGRLAYRSQCYLHKSWRLSWGLSFHELSQSADDTRVSWEVTSTVLWAPLRWSVYWSVNVEWSPASDYGGRAQRKSWYLGGHRNRDCPHRRQSHRSLESKGECRLSSPYIAIMFPTRITKRYQSVLLTSTVLWRASSLNEKFFMNTTRLSVFSTSRVI